MLGTLEAQFDLRQDLSKTTVHNTSKYLKLPIFHKYEHSPMSAKITKQQKKKKEIRHEIRCGSFVVL